MRQGSEAGLRRYYKNKLKKWRRTNMALEAALERTRMELAKARMDVVALNLRGEAAFAMFTDEQRKAFFSQPPPPEDQGKKIVTYERHTGTLWADRVVSGVGWVK